MLVLTRKQDEVILIGNDDSNTEDVNREKTLVRVKILKVKGNTVRVGIEAPPDVRIRRSELLPLTDFDRSPTIHAVPGAGTK